MELLSDSEHETLRYYRRCVTVQTDVSEEANVPVRMGDLRLLLRYIGELEAEMWSYHHG